MLIDAYFLIDCTEDIFNEYQCAIFNEYQCVCPCGDWNTLGSRCSKVAGSLGLCKLPAYGMSEDDVHSETDGYKVTSLTGSYKFSN